MGKKPSNKLIQYSVIGLIVAVIALAGIAFNVSNQSAKTSTETTKVVTETAGVDNFCANNPAVDLKARIKDKLTTTTSNYLNGTLYIKNMDTGSIQTVSIANSGSAFTTSSKLFDCKNLKGYEIYIQQGSGNTGAEINSDGKIVLSPADLNKNPVELTLESSSYAIYKVKVYDNVERAKAVSAPTGSTDFVATATSVFNQSLTSTWATTADQAIDVTLTMQPNVANSAKGNSLIIALDTEDASNLADYDETLTTLWWNGVQLTPATGLSENELRALNSYESVYTTSDTVGMTADGKKSVESTLRVYLQTESGQAKTFDPVIKVVARGDVASIKDDSMILQNVGFKDDTSRSEIMTAQTVTITVGAVGANS